jgi:hypothetical protein
LRHDVLAIKQLLRFECRQQRLERRRGAVSLPLKPSFEAPLQPAFNREIPVMNRCGSNFSSE